MVAARSHPQRGNIAVGTASVNWGFDPLYSWVQTPSFTVMLDEMAAAGYEGTEISYNFPENARMLRDELTRHGLRAAATFHSMDLRDRAGHAGQLATLTPVCDRLQALGADVVILSDKPCALRIAKAGRVAADGSDGLSDRQWHAMADGLNAAGERVAARGMLSVFHPHVGTYVETRSEIDKLCALTDPALLALCPDTGHLAYAGVDAEALFRDYAQRIGYVHLKDVDPGALEAVRAQHIDFVQAVKLGLFVELGTGMVPLPAIIACLRAQLYAGWVIVEQDAPKNPHLAARRNRDYLRSEFEL